MENNLYYYKFNVKRVVDGDTLAGDIEVGFDLTLKDQRIRLLGINTPEMRGLDKPDGIAAKSFVVDVLTDTEVIINSVDKDNFGRILADVYYGKDGEWTYLNDQLLEAGHAVPYE